MHDLFIKGDGPVVSVDDDDMYQEILEVSYKMSKLENEFVKINSGEKCIEYCKKTFQKKEPMPSLILMDINMPGLNGFATVTCIRKELKLITIPIIIMLSSSTDTEDIQEALQVGANSYCEKPFGIDNLKFIREHSNA